MLELALAFALFIALHSIPAMPRIRRRLVATLGHRTYLIVYSLMSVAALGWLFTAALVVDYIELWAPAPWQAWVALVAAPLGLFLVLAGLFSRNPLSISLRTGQGESGAIMAITRHPVLWGFLLWALGHLVANGDLRSLVLFGGFAAFAAGGLFMLDRRTRKTLGAAWPVAAQSSAVIPFKSILAGNAKFRVDTAMTIAAICTTVIVIWLVNAGGHAFLFGADPWWMAFQ